MAINWYRVLSLRNDVKAISKGPDAVAKRIVRKNAYRYSNRATRRFLKSLGL